MGTPSKKIYQEGTPIFPQIMVGSGKGMFMIEILTAVIIILLFMPSRQELSVEIFMELIHDSDYCSELELSDLTWIENNGYSREYMGLARIKSLGDWTFEIEAIRNPTFFRREKMAEKMKIVQ
jgi:hypothetical protein